MKLLLNAYPHAGVEQLYLMVASSIRDNRTSNFHEMAEGDEWTIFKKEPIILLGDYGNDVSLFTIVRNPLENIAMNIDAWFSGLTGQLIYGNEVLDTNNIKKSSGLTEKEYKFLTHQIEVYKSYMVCTQRNSKVNIIKYEDLINKREESVKKILDMSGFNSKFMNYDALSQAPIEFDVPRTEYFEEIKTHIENHKDYPEVLNLYKEVYSKSITV